MADYASLIRPIYWSLKWAYTLRNLFHHERTRVDPRTIIQMISVLGHMCGRLRVGKENLTLAGLGRCSHVFGL
jgi:hypothetical protein